MQNDRQTEHNVTLFDYYRAGFMFTLGAASVALILLVVVPILVGIFSD